MKYIKAKEKPMVLKFSLLPSGKIRARSKDKTTDVIAPDANGAIREGIDGQGGPIFGVAVRVGDRLEIKGRTFNRSW